MKKIQALSIVVALVIISNVFVEKLKQDSIVRLFVTQTLLEVPDARLSRLMPSFQSEELKYGYIDTSGAFAIPPRFDDAGDFHEGLALVRVGNRWGYVSTGGELIIPCQFHRGRDFTYGLAAVRKGRLWGFINRNGDFVVSPEYAQVEDFVDNLAKVSDFSKFGLVNREGALVLPIEAEYVGEFKEGIARVKVDGKYGFFLESGRWLLKPSLEDAADFNEGMAAFARNGKWGYLNSEGVEVIAPEYAHAGSFVGGAAVVGLENGKSLIIDKLKEPLVKGGFDRFAVRVLKPDFSKQILISASGLTPVADPEGWGYASSKSGEIVIETQFPEAQPFFEGFACVGVGANTKATE